MKLKRINYSQHDGKPQEWAVRDLRLGDLNLIVGKNATGKTKIVNFISNFAKVVSGKIKSPMTGNFDLEFEHGDRPIRYVLKSESSRVLAEEFSEGDRRYLTRGTGGIGRIFAQKLNQDIDFQTPETELALVARRDSIQHPFFEPLHEWAASLRSYSFGTQLGKDRLNVAVKGKPTPLSDDDPDAVVAIFLEAERQYQQSFKTAVIKDMAAIGYEIEFIGVMEPESLTVQTSIGDAIGLYVKERSLRGRTDQFDMSQGMFRALSILIHLNYAAKKKMPSCIVIDDIGEGLDYERSCALIELLMSKATTQQVQLIMTTNDRFVMNKVPLEAWTVLHRAENGCTPYNYHNSQEAFENFKYTGLNNFDFFAADFVSGGTDLMAAHDK